MIYRDAMFASHLFCRNIIVIVDKGENRNEQITFRKQG